MYWIFKIGTKWPDDPYRGWRDGQLVEVLPDTTKFSELMRKHFLIVQTQHDYWEMRSSTDWKSTKPEVMDFKKWLCVPDDAGKYKWELGYKEGVYIKRDYFIDPKALLDTKTLESYQFDAIYDKSRVVEPVQLSTLDFILNEKTDTRLIHLYSMLQGSIAVDGAGAGTDGGFTIGAAGDYATVTLFEADIAATLTGDLHGLHLDEETAITADVTFNMDTNSNTLYLTAESGAEHDGSDYGNGARVTMGTYDSIRADDVSGLDDVEISKLALDITGVGNEGVYLVDGADSGLFTVNRMLIAGDADSFFGIVLDWKCTNALVTNNIVYGIGAEAKESGLYITDVYAGVTHTILNNTCVGNYNNFMQNSGGPMAGTIVFKNNIAQNSGAGDDYRDDGAGFGTTAKNISEDATSPDVAYRSKDLHTDTIFKGYGTDDYRLDSGGDATNLAIADDGENLYGSGVTEDIQGQARDNGTPFWIGASHIVAAGGAIPLLVGGGMGQTMGSNCNLMTG